MTQPSPQINKKARKEKNIPEYDFNTVIMITICSSQSIVESQKPLVPLVLFNQLGGARLYHKISMMTYLHRSPDSATNRCYLGLLMNYNQSPIIMPSWLNINEASKYLQSTLACLQYEYAITLQGLLEQFHDRLKIQVILVPHELNLVILGQAESHLINLHENMHFCLV